MLHICVLESYTKIETETEFAHPTQVLSCRLNVSLPLSGFTVVLPHNCIIKTSQQHVGLAINTILLAQKLTGIGYMSPEQLKCNRF